MKCAAAVILRSRGSNVLRSKLTVNHAGPTVFKNESTYVDGVVFSR
jgi:hypothetical protein